MKLVQMMGGAPGLAPMAKRPDDAERWGLNNLYLSVPLRQRFLGWTRWFDLHSNDHIASRKLKAHPWLCQQRKPIYRWFIDPEMPASVIYPQEARQGSRLFCSTLDWMLALAIHEQFTHIDMYGWRMSHPGYQHQITSAEWWIRKAMSVGILVTVHGTSKLRQRALEPVSDIIIPPECLMYGLETTDRSKLYHAK